MPVLRSIGSASLCCALLLVGCPGPTPQCPEATVIADPAEIPSGLSETDVFVEVSNPTPENGLEVITELTPASGAIADPFARETIYACVHDESGEVEICVNVTYAGSDGGSDGGVPEAGVSLLPQSEDPNVRASYQYIGKPHVRLSNPLECSETRCTIVSCPEEKNECPVVSSLTVEPMPPMIVPEGGTATIAVVAEDPDNNPEPLVTTLSARHGTIADPNASTTTYACDPDVGGIIPICVVASDGEASCDFELCTTVRCPGEPLENTCPIIESLTADPMTIPPNETTTTVRVDAMDPDEFPQPLRTELSSATGIFEDRFASETTFICGDPGPVEICVEVSDGACDETRCTTVQCPSTIPPNVCPMLFVLNAIPSTIPSGQTATDIESRAQDTDGLPFPLLLTLRALWGSFENTENVHLPNNVVQQDAIYNCDRPGDVEICVDATDGACLKTLCRGVTCPADVPTP